MIPTLVLASMLGGECAVERSFWPCIDLLDIVPVCDMQDPTERWWCLQSAAALWDVPYSTVTTAWRVWRYGCTVDSEDAECMDLWASCEQPDGQPPICLATSFSACEDQADIGSGDGAGLVCCAAVFGLETC